MRRETRCFSASCCVNQCSAGRDTPEVMLDLAFLGNAEVPSEGVWRSGATLVRQGRTDLRF